MTSYDNRYILYFEKIAGSEEAERAIIDSESIQRTARISEKNLISLAKKFVLSGWRINNKDLLETITPVILNQWAPRPWDTSQGDENMFDMGKMMRYRGCTSEEMDTFYRVYLEELTKTK